MVVQPLYGQVANIFGRRVLMILAVSLFLIGSGISGAAHNMSTLIAGRAIQGSGGGPMTMLTHLILSDITTQRERGNFQSISK
jgi:MFS family permease